MSTFILVAGGGLGGWAWKRIVPALVDAGHDVHPVTLTGTGDRAHQNSAEVDLSTWVTDVVAHITTEELNEVVLVGHSFNGRIIDSIAAALPDQISHLVYLDAVLAQPQRSAFDEMGPDLAGYLESLAAAHDGWSLPWFDDEQLDQNYGDHGFTDSDLEWIRRHVTPQPLATYREPLMETGETSLARTYIRCTRNPQPAPIGPDSDGWTWVELDAGHWPFITMPNETAQTLLSLVNVAQ